MIGDHGDLALMEKDVVGIQRLTEELPAIVNALGRPTESLLGLVLSTPNSEQEREESRETTALAVCDIVETYHRSQALWQELQGSSTTGDAPWFVMLPPRLIERLLSREEQCTREEFQQRDALFKCFGGAIETRRAAEEDRGDECVDTETAQNTTERLEVCLAELKTHGMSKGKGPAS